MNPKDMTNEELVKNHADARAFAENSDYDLARNGALKVSEDCASELLHRLDEADALRKENEELDKWLNRAWLYLCKLCKDHPSWVTVRSLRDAIRFARAARSARIVAAKREVQS